MSWRRRCQRREVLERLPSMAPRRYVGSWQRPGPLLTGRSRSTCCCRLLAATGLRRQQKPTLSSPSGKGPAGTPGVWIHQCGSVAEARSAHAAGADGLILQGVEAGGHVRGVTPAAHLLDQVQRELPAGYPLLLAGGIAEQCDVRRALEAGACAAVAGTRFRLPEESRAHPEYKRACWRRKTPSSPSSLGRPARASPRHSQRGDGTLAE